MISKVLDAIRHNQYKQLALYIRHNYDLNIKTKDGRNGLFIALDISEPIKRTRMLKFLLDNDLDPTQREYNYGYTVLNEAIYRQQLDSVNLLLAYFGGEIDFRQYDTRGRTILHQAVETNNPAIMESLINVVNHYSISVDIPDENGLTPYLLAIKLHLREMATILLKKGRASRQQSDIKSHKNADDWEIEGIQEHRLIIRERLRNEINEALKGGRIIKAKKLRAAYSLPWPIKTLDTNQDEINQNFLSDSFIETSRDKDISVMSIDHHHQHLQALKVTPIHQFINMMPEGTIAETFVNSKPSSDEDILDNYSQSKATVTHQSNNKPTNEMYLNAIVDLFQ
ncbi:unnamed protein product, partial [Didymodactylos carnosus]